MSERQESILHNLYYEGQHVTSGTDIRASLVTAAIEALIYLVRNTPDMSRVVGLTSDDQ